MDIIFIFKLLYRKIWLLLLVPFIAASITFYFARNSVKLYKSSAQMATGFTTNEEISISDERLNIRDAGTKFSNLIEKMNSPQVLSLISYDLMLNDLKMPLQRFRVPRDKDGNLVPISDEERSVAIKILEEKRNAFQLLSSFDPHEREILTLLRRCGYNYEAIEKRLAIKRVSFTDFLSIEYSSENPKLSAFVVNNAMDEIVRYEQSIRSDNSNESLNFFANLMETKKKALDEKTVELNNFKTQNNVVNYELESENRLSQITYYELKRDEEFKNVQALRLSLASLTERLRGMDSEDVQKKKNDNILELRKKINDLNQIYIEGGGTDKKLQGTIENLRERLQIEMANVAKTQGTHVSNEEISRLKTEQEDVKLKLKIAEANLQSINSTLWGMKGNASSQASTESIISNLQREVDRAQEEYLQALDKFNFEKSKSLISGSGLKAILRAQPAGEPESSKTLLKTFLAFFISFILCVVGVVMVEFLDLSIKTPAQFQRMTKLDLSGVLNVMKAASALNLEKLFYEEDASPVNKLLKHRIRKIRVEIEGNDSQVILVTSTQEQVGKSFLIICLAYSLSLIHKKVLIIDTNFKNNTLSKLLLSKPTDYKLLKRAETVKRLGPVPDVVEEEEEDPDFKSIISRTVHKNVHIIGSKHSNESPSEVLSGKQFSNLLADLKQSYDYIFLEGAALNDYSDSKELISFADKVLPVFSAEITIKEIDKQSIKYLRNLNGKLMGSVLNKVREKDLKN